MRAVPSVNEIKQWGNQLSPFCLLLLSFGRCVASLELYMCGEMQRRKDMKKRKCEGGKMRMSGEKNRFPFSPFSALLQFLFFTFHHTCTISPAQCHRSYVSSRR